MPASPPPTDRRVLRDVAVGGAVGALLRTGVLAAVVALLGTDLPGVVAVNLVGAGLLGLLVRSRRDPVWLARGPLLGTGLLGAFTTYSGLVVPIALLLGDGHAPAAVVVGVGCLLTGLWVACRVLRSGPA